MVKKTSFNVKRTIAQIASVLLLGGAVTVHSRFLVPKFTNHITLQEARKEQSKRQGFLDDLLSKEKIPYCSGVVYDNDGTKLERYVSNEISSFSQNSRERNVGDYRASITKGLYNAMTPEVFQLSGLNRPSKIFVGRLIFEGKGFEYIGTNEFKHIITVHEAVHARQHALGLSISNKRDILIALENGSLNENVLYRVFELEANYEGLKKIMDGKRKVNPLFEREIKRKFVEDCQYLIKASKFSSEYQKNLIIESLDKTKDLIEISF